MSKHTAHAKIVTFQLILGPSPKSKERCAHIAFYPPFVV